jgi:hypothetical protein
MNKDNAPKEFLIYTWGKEIEDWVKIPWEEEKSVGELETSVLRELISPKSSKIPQRNQEIGNGGLGVTLTVETSEEESEKWEVWWMGKFCPGGLYLQKPDSLVFKTGQFSFS